MLSKSFNDAREAVSPVMTVAREAADPRAIPAHHQPVAVMLDFVAPQRGPVGGRTAFVGWHNSMKPEGRWTMGRRIGQ